MINGELERRKHHRAELAWLAWHTAHLTAYAPEKSTNFTRLEKLLPKGSHTEQRVRPWERDFAAIKAFMQAKEQR